MLLNVMLPEPEILWRVFREAGVTFFDRLAVAEAFRSILHHLTIPIADGHVLMQRQDNLCLWQARAQFSQELNAHMCIMMHEDDIRPDDLEKLTQIPLHRDDAARPEAEPVS